MTKTTDGYLEQSSEETLKTLQVNIDQGLSTEAAANRLKQYGPNTISEKEDPLWHRIFRRFWDPIGWTYALYMWLYALIWFVFNDVIKMLTYRFLRKRGEYI